MSAGAASVLFSFIFVCFTAVDMVFVAVSLVTIVGVIIIVVVIIAIIWFIRFIHKSSFSDYRKGRSRDPLLSWFFRLRFFIFCVIIIIMIIFIFVYWVLRGGACLRPWPFGPQVRWPTTRSSSLAACIKVLPVLTSNEPFWHFSKSAYRYSWFTRKQTIEPAESAVKKSKMDSTA